MKEPQIEDAVIRNPSVLAAGEGLFIRRCRMGRRFGSADLVFLPERGTRRILVIEAKSVASHDIEGRVLGQLLMYYAGALKFGARGIRLMRQFARDHPELAQSPEHPKSLKALSGGMSPPERAWQELCKGRKLQPERVGLALALDGEPPTPLAASIAALGEHHRLEVGVLIATPSGGVEAWRPAS